MIFSPRPDFTFHSFVEEFNKIGDDVDASVKAMARESSESSFSSALGLGSHGETEEDILRDRIQMQRGAAFKGWIGTAILHFATHKAWEGDFDGADDPRLSLFVEQYVVERIYVHLFFPNKRRDFEFAQTVQAISHMTAESLDIKHPVTEELVAACGART